MMTIDEMIAVLEHAKNGGKVQARNPHDTEWHDFEEGVKPSWLFSTCDYRAKPEPLFIYAEIMADGKAIQFSTEKFYITNGGTVRKFVEVAE